MSHLEHLKKEYALSEDFAKINNDKLLQLTIINNMVSTYGMSYVEKLKTFNETINKSICDKVYIDANLELVNS